MKVSVIGLGYVGLPVACIVSHAGHQVLGVDIQDSVINTLNSSQCHISEPKVQQLLNSSIHEGSIRFSLHLEESDVFIICVPTPVSESYESDTSYVKMRS